MYKRGDTYYWIIQKPEIGKFIVMNIRKKYIGFIHNGKMVNIEIEDLIKPSIFGRKRIFKSKSHAYKRLKKYIMLLIFENLLYV